MYDLNYTYLTDLEVDTRQSFSDLSDDLLLLDNNDTVSETVDMDNLISAWQDFFWKSRNPNKQKLDVTFTDLSIYHERDISTLRNADMLNIDELDRVFSGINWCGHYASYDDMKTSLCSALAKLQEIYTVNNIHPKGAVIINEINPGSQTGSWQRQNASYIAEQITAITGMHIGYNDGNANNTVNNNIQSLMLTPTANGVQTHTHKLTFVPASGSGSGSNTSTATGATFKNVRRGKDKPTGENIDWSAVSSWYSGHDDNHTKSSALIVATDAYSNIKGKTGKATAKFSVGSTEIKSDNTVAVAPTTYPLSATIWEKKQ